MPDSDSENFDDVIVFWHDFPDCRRIDLDEPTRNRAENQIAAPAVLGLRRFVKRFLPLDRISLQVLMLA